MKNLVITIAGCCFLFQSYAQNIQWTQTGGGLERDETFGVAGNTGGNCFVTGAFTDTAVIGGTTLYSSDAADAFLAGYNASGGLNWIYQMPGAGNQSGHQATVDNNNNLYVAGEFENSITIGTVTLTSAGGDDIFIARFDASGNPVWAVKAGGPGNEEVNAIKCDLNGNIYITGNFESTAAFGSAAITSAGGFDIFVSKLTPTSQFLWTSKAGGPQDDEAHGLAVSTSSEVYITGFFQGTATFGLNSFTSNSGSKDIFISYLSAVGGFNWTVKAGGPDNDAAYDATIDNLGNCYISGNYKSAATFGPFVLNSNGGDDIFILKMNSSATYLWSSSAGGTGEDKGYGITLAGNSVAITGSFENSFSVGPVPVTSTGDRDAFAALVNLSSGAFTWAEAFGGPGFDRGYNISSKGIDTWVTGVFEQTATFAGSTYNSAGMTDLFLCKLGGTTGIADETPGYDVLIYPNPCNSHLYLQLPVNVTGVEIINPNGQILFSNPSEAGSTQKVNVENFADGVYFLRLVQGSASTYSMFIKSE